ncbi:MAG: hypothetical protein QOE66_1490, partial [Chloroflexota bacterium]|nr:hypothetical protein [Chloroflexota bacterium]
MMAEKDDEEARLRAVTLQNAQSILVARRRAEEALREQAEWLKVTLASIGDAVISTDAEGRVTFLNGVAEALTGWTQAEAVGRPLPEVFTIINEETRQTVENPALRALREGMIVGLANHTVLIARDGTERPIDDSAAPIRDEGGTTLGAVLVFRDVTERRRAEDARARLAAIVDSSDDAIVSKTLDGVIRSWNAGAERLFGYTAAEAVGRSITLIIPPERQDEERAILERLRRGERVEHFETVRVAKGGRRVDISLTVSPVRDDEGRIIGASKIARDITERRRAEAERRLLQEAVEVERARLAEVFRRAPSFLAILRGPKHVFELANDRYYQLIGGRDIVGKPIREALPEVEGQGFVELLDRVYRTGEAFVGTDLRVLVQREPGRPLEERFVEFIYQPLRDADGTVSGILAQGVDLTDRKRAEAAVRERDERLRLFLGHATDYAFIITDPEGLTLAWQGGAEQITGWRADEIFGKPASVLFTPEERAAGVPEAEMARAAQAGRAEDRRWHMRKDGSRFFADGVMVGLRGPAGELRGFGKVFRDATEQKRSEEALREAKREAEEANNAKTQFLAMLSHELRTPLNPILLAVTAMLERPEEPEQLRTTLEMIRQNVNLQARLIDDL